MSKKIRTRIHNANCAMEGVGISKAKVKPVLKNLLKLYDGNWEHIESENYRALLDAIFEREPEERKGSKKTADSKVAKHSKKTFNNEGLEEQAQAVKESRQSSKRLRVRYQNEPAELHEINESPGLVRSPQPRRSSRRLQLRYEPDELPEVNESQDLVSSPQPSAENARSDPHLLSKKKGKQHISPQSLLVHEISDLSQPSSIKSPHAMNLRDGEKKSASPQTSSGEKGSLADSSPQACLKESKVVCDTVLTPKQKHGANYPIIFLEDESVTDDMPQFMVPLAVSHPDDVLHTEDGKIYTEETNCLSLVVANQPQVTPEIILPLNVIIDIAKGQENVVITMVNEVNTLSSPSFHYMTQNVVWQNAYVNFSVAHIGDDSCCPACLGDCLSSSVPCACAHVVGGGFAYTTDGLVKEELIKYLISMNRDPKKRSQIFCEECPLEKSKNEDIIEPCKGHLVRKFIKECWLRCGCNKQCGNRVVQRGITRNLQVFMTPEGKGWGLRTLENLPQGAFVCEYVGEVLTNSEFFCRVLRNPKREKHSYPVVLDADWDAEKVLKDEEALCLDATYYGNVARFINHRCYDPNLVEIPVEVETSDHHYYRVALFTAREIMAFEELTWDYGIEFGDHDHPIKAFHCECGSKFCRSIRRSRKKSFMFNHMTNVAAASYLFTDT